MRRESCGENVKEKEKMRDSIERLTKIKDDLMKSLTLMTKERDSFREKAMGEKLLRFPSLNIKEEKRDERDDFYDTNTEINDDDEFKEEEEEDSFDDDGGKNNEDTQTLVSRARFQKLQAELMIYREAAAKYRKEKEVALSKLEKYERKQQQQQQQRQQKRGGGKEENTAKRKRPHSPASKYAVFAGEVYTTKDEELEEIGNRRRGKDDEEEREKRQRRRREQQHSLRHRDEMNDVDDEYSARKKNDKKTDDDEKSFSFNRTEDFWAFDKKNETTIKSNAFVNPQRQQQEQEQRRRQAPRNPPPQQQQPPRRHRQQEQHQQNRNGIIELDLDDDDDDDAPDEIEVIPNTQLDEDSMEIEVEEEEEEEEEEEDVQVPPGERPSRRKRVILSSSEDQTQTTQSNKNNNKTSVDAPTTATTTNTNSTNRSLSAFTQSEEFRIAVEVQKNATNGLWSYISCIKRLRRAKVGKPDDTRTIVFNLLAWITRVDSIALKSNGKGGYKWRAKIQLQDSTQYLSVWIKHDHLDPFTECTVDQYASLSEPERLNVQKTFQKNCFQFCGVVLVEALKYERENEDIPSILSILHDGKLKKNLLTALENRCEKTPFV
mmetsp:Transcript_6507/g.21731  ORF Transcript_6507/g.21731 Transcript_6507/m.21731 type:complete len:604 (-) Transcript_6507:105-1916(-)